MRLRQKSLQKFRWFFGRFGDTKRTIRNLPTFKVNGLIDGWANPTGVLLVMIFLVIAVGAHPGIKKKGHFEIFYWTHLLYLPFMLLLILHCDKAVWWIGIPCAIFLAGKAKMIKQWIDGSGKSYVVCGTLLPSNVREQKTFS